MRPAAGTGSLNRAPPGIRSIAPAGSFCPSASPHLAVSPLPDFLFRPSTAVHRESLAYLLQLACGRGLRETVGKVVEPCLILILEVEQSAYRILPALRAGSAVLRWSVMALRLRCLVALSITALALGIGQSHDHCAPLRNGPTSRGRPVRVLRAIRCELETARAPTRSGTPGMRRSIGRWWRRTCRPG